MCNSHVYGDKKKRVNYYVAKCEVISGWNHIRSVTLYYTVHYSGFIHSLLVLSGLPRLPTPSNGLRRPFSFAAMLHDLLTNALHASDPRETYNKRGMFELDGRSQ